MPGSSELDVLLGEVRRLTEEFKGGGRHAFSAFRDLAQLILTATVVPVTAYIGLYSGPRGPVSAVVLGGMSAPLAPLPLNDGRHLRLTMTLYLAPRSEEGRVKVEKAAIQYQVDPEPGTSRWVFRYDYIRDPRDHHPPSHVQIRGQLTEKECLPDGVPLERIHFPTARMSLEAIVRLLADQFGVPCNKPPKVWRALLAESERAFLQIAHQAPSGPDR